MKLTDLPLSLHMLEGMEPSVGWFRNQVVEVDRLKVANRAISFTTKDRGYILAAINIPG